MITDNGLKIACKLLSGRWLLTVITGIVFAVITINGTLPADDAKVIIGVITTFYFTRQRSEVKV